MSPSTFGRNATSPTLITPESAPSSLITSVASPLRERYTTPYSTPIARILDSRIARSCRLILPSKLRICLPGSYYLPSANSQQRAITQAAKHARSDAGGRTCAKPPKRARASQTEAAPMAKPPKGLAVAPIVLNDLILRYFQRLLPNEGCCLDAILTDYRPTIY